MHGTTPCRPVELSTSRRRLLLPGAPLTDLPMYATAKVHRDHHIEVAKALYSVPGNLIGRGRGPADRQLVLSFRGSWSRSIPASARRKGDRPRRPAGGEDHLRHPRHGHLSTWPTARARHRRLCGRLVGHPVAVDQDAPGLRPVGPGQEVGSGRVDSACARALDAEALSVPLIGRMIERATENHPVQEPLPVMTRPARFARDPAHFATPKPGGAA